MTASADIRTDLALEQGFRLGDLRIEPLEGVVSGPGGREKLDPKVMNVLVMLARHAGHVVLREDLLTQLWPKAVVTDDVLSRCIYELRQHLGQAGGDEQLKSMIETVPKRGYRLSGEVTPAQPPPGARSRGRLSRMALTLGIVVAATTALWLALGRPLTWLGGESPQPSAGTVADSIAVLPFLDLSEGQDQGYLADGISEEILNRLTQLAKLRVISRTSSFAFRGKPLDIREIATTLDVSHVLEGSIRRSGNSIRITAQLIAATDNSHVWSDTFDRELGDLFAVQDEIAASVATALQIALKTDPPGERRPANAVAYENYLYGRFLYNRRAPGDVQRAATRFQQAVAADPLYAVAWASLAGAYAVLAHSGEMSLNAAQEAQLAAAQEAVRIDPHLADGYYRLADYYFEVGDISTGRSNHLTAYALDPNNSPSDDPSLRMHEELDKTIRDGQRELARDPLSAVAHMNHALVLFAAGRLDEAKSHILKTQELSPDFGPEPEMEMVRILVAERQYAEAHARALRLPEARLRDHGLALLFDAPGHRAEADAALDRLAKLPVGQVIQSMRLAEVYALRGMPDKAFAALDRFKGTLDPAEKRTASRLWWMQLELGLSPFLTALHDDPRWTALMARVG